MPIKLNEPVVVPAKSEKTFDGLFVTDLIVNCDQQKGNLFLTYCPYNTSTGELLLESKQNIAINDFWNCITHVPQAALALNHVLSSVLPLKEWYDSHR